MERTAVPPSWPLLLVALFRPSFSRPSDAEAKRIANPTKMLPGETPGQYRSQLDRVARLREAKWSERDRLRYFQDGLRNSPRYCGVLVEAERTLISRGVDSSDLEYQQLYEEVERQLYRMQQQCSRFATSSHKSDVARATLVREWGEAAVETELRRLGIGGSQKGVTAPATTPQRGPAVRQQPRVTAAAGEAWEHQQPEYDEYPQEYRYDRGAPAHQTRNPAGCSLCGGKSHGDSECLYIFPDKVAVRFHPNPDNRMYPALYSILASRPRESRLERLQKIHMAPQDAEALRRMGEPVAAVATGQQRGQQGGGRGRQQPQRQPQFQQQQQQQLQRQQQQQGDQRRRAGEQPAAAVAALPLVRMQQEPGPPPRPAAYFTQARYEGPAALVAHRREAVETPGRPATTLPLIKFQSPIAMMTQARSPEPAAYVTTRRQELEAIQEEPSSAEEQEEEALPPARGTATIQPYLPLPLGEGPIPPRPGVQQRRRGTRDLLNSGKVLPLQGRGDTRPAPVLPTHTHSLTAVVQLPLSEIAARDSEGAAGQLLGKASQVLIEHGAGHLTQHPTTSLYFTIPLPEYESVTRGIAQQGSARGAIAAAASQARAFIKRGAQPLVPLVGDKQYLQSLLHNRPTVYRVECAPTATADQILQGISILYQGNLLGIDIAGVDTCCDILLFDQDIAKKLGVKIRPSETTVSQSNGRDEPVLGVPDQPISLVLGYQTDRELVIELKRVYIHRQIGAGVKVLIGTEALNKGVSVIDLRPPRPRWVYHTWVNEETQELGPEGELPITVCHRDQPITVGMAAQVQPVRDTAVAMVSSVGSAGGESVSLSPAEEGPCTAGEPASVTPTLPAVEYELQDIFVEGALRPDYTRTGKPPRYTALLTNIYTLLHHLEEKGEPLQPELEPTSSLWSQQWRPQGIDRECVLELLVWEDHRRVEHPGGLVVPPTVQRDIRWQVAGRLATDPGLESLFLGQVTREQYEEDDQLAWRYILLRVYVEAYRRFVQRHPGEMDLWSFEGVDDNTLSAYLYPYLQACNQLGVGPYLASRICGEVEAQLERSDSLTRDLGEQGIPHWGGTALRKPNFYTPLEEAWFRPTLERVRGKEFTPEPEKDKGTRDWGGSHVGGAARLEASKQERWAYTALQVAIYGESSPGHRVHQRTWETMTLPQRAALKREVKYHQAYQKFSVELEELAYSRRGALNPFLFTITDVERAQAPSESWAMDYMRQGGEVPSPPDNHFYICREVGLAKSAQTVQEWQWSLDSTLQDPRAPLCAAVAAAIQEPRRWAWVQQQQRGFLFTGHWDQQTEEQVRAAYLRQLYLTAWRMRTDHGTRLFRTPARTTTSSGATEGRHSPDLWHTPTGVASEVTSVGAEWGLRGDAQGWEAGDTGGTTAAPASVTSTDTTTPQTAQQIEHLTQQLERLAVLHQQLLSQHASQQQ